MQRITASERLPGGITVYWETKGEEMETSYEENATRKALHFGAATGFATLADDSGIEVTALGGGPGVLSARYGGPELDDRGRTERLLEAMAETPDGRRQAKYVAVVALKNRRLKVVGVGAGDSDADAMARAKKVRDRQKVNASSTGLPSGIGVRSLW